MGSTLCHSQFSRLLTRHRIFRKLSFSDFGRLEKSSFHDRRKSGDESDEDEENEDDDNVKATVVKGM